MEGRLTLKEDSGTAFDLFKVCACTRCSTSAMPPNIFTCSHVTEVFYGPNEKTVTHLQVLRLVLQDALKQLQRSLQLRRILQLWHLLRLLLQEHKTQQRLRPYDVTIRCINLLKLQEVLQQRPCPLKLMTVEQVRCQVLCCWSSCCGLLNLVSVTAGWSYTNSCASMLPFSSNPFQCDQLRDFG